MTLKSFTPFFIFVLFLSPFVAAQEKEIILPPSQNINSREIFVIAEQKSELAKDGGYLANPSVVDCFAEMSYRYTGGRYTEETIKFRFRSPDKIEQGKKYPLVIWMHGSGESGNDNKRQLAHIQSTMEFLAGKNKLDFFVLATQCPGDNNQWTSSVSHENKGDAPLVILQEILDKILIDYPIDKNRMSVVGVCSGGFGAWSLLESRPDFFSAMATFSSATPSVAFWNEHYRKTSLWTFNNQDDNSIPVEPMRKAVAQIKNTGSFAYLTERPGGHDSWTKAMRDDKIIAWLVLQDREHFSPPPGIILYPHHHILIPIFLFVLPILFSVSLLLFQIIRRWHTK